MSEQSPIINIDSVELTPGGNGTRFANRTARLAAKTLADVVLYPDSGKVAAVSGAFPKPLWHITGLSSTAGGYDGEA